MPRKRENPTPAKESQRVTAEWNDAGHASLETLHASLDGQLDEQAAIALDVHVHMCRTCADAADDARKVRTTVSRLLRTLDDPSFADSATHASASTARVTTPESVKRSAIMTEPSVSRAQFTSAETATFPSLRRSQWRNRRVVQLTAGAVLAASGALWALSQRPHPTVPVAQRIATDSPLAIPVPSPMQSGVSTRSDGDNGDAFKNFTPIRTRFVVTGHVYSGARKRRPIEGAQVIIAGTDIATVTDSAGFFTLRDVPGRATSVEARSTIGYLVGSVPLDFSRSDMIEVSVTVRQQMVQINPVVVAGGNTIDVLPRTECLRPARGSRPFTMIRGGFTRWGIYRLDLVDWPIKGRITNAAFALEADGSLHGFAKDPLAHIGVTVAPHGAVWSGMATEQRNGRSESYQLVLRSESSSAACRK